MLLLPPLRAVISTALRAKVRLLCILLNEHILQRVAPLSEEIPEDEAQAKCSSTVDADHYDATAKAYFTELAKAWNVEMSAVAK